MALCQTVLGFDLDDTLWSAVRTLADAHDALVAATPALPERVRSPAGFKSEMARVMEEHPDKAHDFAFVRRRTLRGLISDEAAAEAAYQVWFKQRNSPVLFPGVVDTLHALKRKGFRLCAISDGNSRPMEIPVLQGIFDFAVNAADAGAAKPDGRIFRLAAEKAGVPCSAFVYIGDNYKKDVLGSKAAGMRAVWVRTQAEEHPDFLVPKPSGPEDGASVADAEVASVTELPKVLDSMLPAAGAAGASLDPELLLAACIHLARRAGGIIREVHQSGRLDAHNKVVSGDTRGVEAMEGNEVLTIADGRAQDAIITSLRSMFPGLRIVGEEGESPAEEPATALSEVKPLDQPLALSPELREAFTLENVCLWIDPLDGTKEFALGRTENVSVLIGIAVHDRPVAGVIFQPFVGEAGQGKLLYGALGAGVMGDQTPVPAAPPKALVVITNKKTSESTRFKMAWERLAEHRPELLLSNGAGEKLLRVLRGNASVYVVGPSTSRWDTCAGEALLAAIGGKLSDMDGSVIPYAEHGSHSNSEGFIAARTPEIQELLVRALSLKRPAEAAAEGQAAKRPA